jgi:CBS domain containing-hemolysin-like protein
MSGSTITHAIAVLLLLGASAFFVAAEFALIGIRIEREADEGIEGAQVRRARRDLERAVSGTQLGLAVASLALGWLGVTLLAPWIAGAIAAPSGPSLALGVLVSLGLIAVAQVLFAELVPRAIALARPDRVARVVAPALNLFNALMAPILWALNRAAERIVRRGGAKIDGIHGRVHSPEEIERLLRQSRVQGVVEEDEEEMIHGVFELTRTVAREVMTPRPDIVAFPETASLDHVLDTAAASGFSRFPVYRESIDDVTGVVLVKDLLRWMRHGDAEKFTIPGLMREPFFVPDTKPVDDLLAEFRAQALHLAVVVDEFGGTDGVVTLEDLVEEIVGDIFDEHDVPEEEIVVLGDGEARIDGGADPADVIERFMLGQIDDAEEYDTVAGYVIGRLGRIPEIGETVRLGGAELEVAETLEQRVTRLRLRLAPKEEPEGRPGDRDAAGTEPH